MNLGQRIAGALAALSGALSADLAANTTADGTFRDQTSATLTALGAITTDLKAQVDELAAAVEAGETVNPAVFADLKAKIDSLDEAFPDAEQAPPAADEPEDPIVDEGTEGAIEGAEDVAEDAAATE